MTIKTNISLQELLLSCVIWLMALTACSDNSGFTVDPPGSGQFVRLNSDIVSDTRSSINVFNGETVAFAKGDVSGSYTEVWPAVADQTDTRLVDRHLYPADGSRIYLRAYYPSNPIADGRTVYHLDGRTDLMATTEHSGNMMDNFSLPDKIFLFNHLLAQVNFAVRLTGGEANEGVRLSYLRLRGSRPEATLLLSEARPEQLPEVLFDGESQPYTAYVEPSRYGGILLSSSPVSLPYSLLVEPGASLTLDVRLHLSPTETKEYRGLAIRFDDLGGLSRPGTAYLINVGIRPSGGDGSSGDIQVSASVQPWEIGGTGSGSVSPVRTTHSIKTSNITK